MKCPGCNAEVNAAKFCANCGAPLAKEEVKHRTEVTAAWILEIYKSLGYELVGEVTESEGNSGFFVKHVNNPNLSIDFRPTLRVLLATSTWSIKPPGLMERGEFFRTVNSMNVETVCCQCAVAEKDMDSLAVQLTFFLTDNVSRLDLIEFNELTTRLTRRVINQPRVQKVMT